MLRERIGEGGMGIVYLADQPALARTVAIKVLRPELAGTPALARRFREEAVVGASVRHPRAVAVIDSSLLPDGTPYIVMEHVRGRSLGHVIAHDDIPVARAIDLALQILSVLEAAHTGKVVHADVKSDNFLVEHVDGGDHVKLIDFGLARFVGAVGTLAGDELGDRVVSGTPEYMAPETIVGEPASPASDLYAAGVILYELLTGSTPFSGGTPADIMARQVDEIVIPPSLRAGDRDIPAALDAVVLRALAKFPGARFTDAAEFAAALRAAAPARSLPPPRASRPFDGATPEMPTRNCTAPVVRQRFARGSGCNGDDRDAFEEMRRSIGDAIVRGEVAAIADGYLRLARALAGQQRFAAASRELEEGVAVLAESSFGERLIAALVALRGAPRRARPEGA